MTRPTLPTHPFEQTSSAGTAAIISDGTSSFWTNLVANVNEHASALDTGGIPSTTYAIVETKTSGAASLTAVLTRLSVTGAQAFSLADGTVDGQQKEFYCSVAATSPAGTLTVATMDTAGGGVNATFVFNAVGQGLRLVWNGTAWHILSLTTAGRLAVVVGTTVLTGCVMNRAFDLSVTGTAHSTTTKGVPNGRYPGQRLHIDVTTAATIPVGDIAITAQLAAAGTAATSLAHLTDTQATLDVEWDGAAWQAIQFTAGAGTATLS